MPFTPRAGPYGTRLTVHRTAGCAVASPSSTTVVSTAVEHGGLGYRLPCSRSACSAPTGDSLPQRWALLPALKGGVSAPGEFYERARQLVVAPAELPRVGRPDRLEHLEELVRSAAPVREGRADGVELILRPPDPEPHAHAPAREHVERRQLPGEEDRIVIREVEDTGPEGHTARPRRHEDQRRDRVQDALVRGGQRAVGRRGIRGLGLYGIQEALRDPEAVIAERLGRLLG